MPSLWADSLKNTNNTMDKLIVNYDDAMTEYPTGCVLSVKSTTMDAVIPGEDYLIVTKEYEAIRRIQTSVMGKLRKRTQTAYCKPKIKL